MTLGNMYQTEVFEKIKSQQVYKEDRFHVVMIKIKKDELLKPHTSTTDAFLTVVEGSIIFNLHEEDTRLKKGDMISFKANEIHSVKALDDATILVVK